MKADNEFNGKAGGAKASAAKTFKKPMSVNNLQGLGDATLVVGGPLLTEGFKEEWISKLVKGSIYQ